ncbi:RNA polymerase Rpb4-domain-containing protein [Corynascus similis CBS 632.67]|uniref:DNA-directed RNA polymerase III subunit RPC9 n=1 Tax=Corynascus novoguineensis TaxID=1126955 RepID=A0AAN7CRQ9_9PEZI|nr:RNA polymerase Rpb4-domain-containing protein [Corynascus novoguineensis]
MKILESQNALLSNYEVYQHIIDQRKRNKAQNRRVPANAHQIMTEVVTYLSAKPSPLEKQEETQAYSAAAINRLFERIREANLPSELTKSELLSILNQRPSSTALLSTAIEDMEERFSDEDQNRIVDIIAEVLGRDETDEGGEEDEMDADVAPTVENGR